MSNENHNGVGSPDPTHEEVLSKEEVHRRLKEMRASFGALIEKYGFAVMGVIEGHIYSIGVANKGLPDLVVTLPVPHNVGAEFIKGVLTSWERSGYSLKPLTLDFDQMSVDVQLRPLARTEQLLSTMVVQNEVFYQEYPEYYQERIEMPDYVQIVLADHEGRFPDENGYEKETFPQVLLEKAS
ncbi:MAG: DUF4262 domain-containing protein [Aestuariibacter sp.]|nr:DUF4262 domain-containing protein [Aestuariibacter sp.]|tara:strand:+ start:131922 stop:132470 length:549 start_codon:yes stop_codon:yes gene_type:complete